MRTSSVLTATLLALSATSTASGRETPVPAGAKPAPAPAPLRPVTAQAPAGAGQPALGVGFTAQGALRAAVCPAAPCAVAGGEEIAVPNDARARAASARLSVVGIGEGRRAIVVAITGPDPVVEWKALVVAPLAGGKPEVVFQGWTGLVNGQEGERHGPYLTVSELEEGSGRRIVIGEIHEELSLCGRPAVLAPKLLSPDDLKLHPAKVQRLTPDERASAQRVVARRIPDPAPAPAVTLLRAVAASSAVGAPAALTDGDPETTWAENRGGSGRGEFVLMHAPPELSITGLELRVRPAKASPEHGVSPREIWLASPRRVIHVTLPEDAWKSPGASYEIALAEPLRTDCLALVTESAYGDGKSARVTFAELSARSEFAASSVDALIAALAGGGERSQAAASVLRALGKPGYDATARAFRKLDEGGRRVALDIIDTAPCETSAPVYVAALRGPHAAQRLHARDRLRRCGEQGAELLLAALDKAKPRELAGLADELALIAPDRAVGALLPRLSARNVRLRRELRVVLARAAAASRAEAAVRAALGDAALPDVAAIDLLRALGPRARQFLPESGRTFARLASPQAELRTRFLLLEPAAELEAKDDGARAFLRRALVLDASPHVRAQAARLVPRPAEYRDELVRALDDGEVRVREAAIETLGERRGDFAAAGIARRLDDDRWPIVRAAAAEALGSFGPSRDLDSQLREALDDESAFVRAPVVRALGARRATAYAPLIRERLEDATENPLVRASAAASLGLMCDRDGVDALTRHAKRLADPMLDAEARSVAQISLAALARIRPPDLRDRLRPLLDPSAPRPARAAAEAALQSKGSCPH